MRERAQLLITNPDMLHMSILPVHRQFSRILSNLRHVIVDEGHAYRWGPLTFQLIIQTFPPLSISLNVTVDENPRFKPCRIPLTIAALRGR